MFRGIKNRMNAETESKQESTKDQSKINALSNDVSLVERIEDLMNRENRLETALAETQDSHLRLRAEFDNFRKHVRAGHIVFSPYEIQKLVDEKPSDAIIRLALALKYEKPWVKIVTWTGKKYFDYLEYKKKQKAGR